jgi:hypothetical protein
MQTLTTCMMKNFVQHEAIMQLRTPLLLGRTVLANFKSDKP